MKKRYLLIAALSGLLVTSGAVYAKKPADDPVPNPDPGQKEYPATPNLSFPMIATDIIEIFYQKVWVEDDIDIPGVLPEVDGYGVPDASEWVIGYDTLDEEVDDDSDGVIDRVIGDGVIDNVVGNGVPVPIDVEEENITDVYDGAYAGNTTFWYQTYVVGDDGKTVDLLTQTWEDLDGDGLELTEWVSFLGADGNPDLTDPPVPMLGWLTDMAPWYDQPVFMDGTTSEIVTTFDGLLEATIPVAENPNNIWNVGTEDAPYLDGTEIGGENSWQADWKLITDTDNDPFTPEIRIDFIDWGNPLENTVYPTVGQRFPVEMALYEKTGSSVVGDAWGETMTSYKMACLEYPSTRVELFGTSKLDGDSYTKEIYFATVLTNKFFAEVEDPKGGVVKIPIEPGIGPSGKINFASAGGGWTPAMSGWHRIWMHFTDPLISLSGAIVNNDEHYIMSTGYMAEPLNKNKEELVGVVGDSTFIDVYVLPAKKK